MAYSLFSFSILILLNLLKVSVSKDNCPVTRSCNLLDYVSVKFPFRIAQYQSNTRCSYNSSFTLSCNASNQTILNLPTAGSFAVHDIYYGLQAITLSDPDRCLPQRFLNFNISTSPFRPASSQVETYIYYNCTSLKTSTVLSSYKEPCMSGKNHTVIVFRNYDKYWLRSELKENNCTFIKTVEAPYYVSTTVKFNLYWEEPQCKACETGAKSCGLKSGSDLIIECQGGNFSFSSPVNITLILFLVLFPGVLVTMCVFAWMCNRHFERTEEQRQRSLTVTETVRTQPSITTTGSSETAIESHPMFILGEGDVLLEPNVSPCAICLGEYMAGESLRTILDCNHFFHSHCVDEWLKIRGTCPVCRKGA